MQYSGSYSEVRFEGSKRIVNDRQLEVTVDSSPRKPWGAVIKVYDGTHKALRTYPVASAYVTNQIAVYLGQGTPPLVLVIEGAPPRPASQAVDTPMEGHIVMDGVAGPTRVEGKWHTRALFKRR
jgi:hypothetical protein